MPIRPRSGSRHVDAPQKIVIQFFGTGLFETKDFAPLRVDSGHDVADCPVFAGSIHSLKDEKQRITAGRIVKVLQ